MKRFQFSRSAFLPENQMNELNAVLAVGLNPDCPWRFHSSASSAKMAARSFEKSSEEALNLIISCVIF